MGNERDFHHPTLGSTRQAMTDRRAPPGLLHGDFPPTPLHDALDRDLGRLATEALPPRVARGRADPVCRLRSAGVRGLLYRCAGRRSRADGGGAARRLDQRLGGPGGVSVGARRHRGDRACVVCVDREHLAPLAARHDLDGAAGRRPVIATLAESAGGRTIRTVVARPRRHRQNRPRRYGGRLRHRRCRRSVRTVAPRGRGQAPICVGRA